MSGFGVPVKVDGMTDLSTGLINIQRSLSNLFSTIGSITVTTNFVIDASPFLNNGTVSASGTVTAAPMTGTGVLGGHTGTVAGVVAIGSGLSLTAGNTLVSTSSGGTVTKISTASPGISGGAITSAGTLAVQWNGGQVDTLGPGFTIGSGTLTADWHGGTVGALANRLSLAAGTLDVIQVLGTTTNSSAAAGIVGEFISSTVLVGAAVSLITATPENVTTISLSAGDWDVWGTVAFAPAGTTTITVETGGINTTSATLPTPPGSGAYASFAESFTTGATDVFSVGTTRVSLAAPATVYLVAQASFAISTMGAYGFIGARRVR